MIPHTFLPVFAPVDQSGGGRGLMIFVFQMAAIIAIFYFLIIRPEVIHLKDDRVTLKTGESRVVVQRDRIAEIRTPKPVEEEKKPS